MKRIGVFDVLALLSTLSALGACGGGGSSSSPKPTPPPPPAIAALTLASATPSNGAIDIARNVTPTLVFSAGIDPTTAIAANITLSSALGSQPISIASSGTQLTITPASALKPATSYTLRVSTALRGIGGEQPASAIDIAFTTNDEHWNAPALIETDDAGNAARPKIAVDAEGNALAVWQQSDGMRNKIWFNRYTVAGGWGVATQLDPSSTFETNAADIATDGAGNAIVVWTQADITSFNVWWSRYTPATGFSVPAPLSSSDHAGNVRIAMNSAGDAVAVWVQSTPSQTAVRRYSPATGWSAVGTLQSSFDFAALAPQVAIDQNGNATTVWAQSDGTRYHVWANRLTSGTWTGAQMAENTSTGPSTNLFPQLAMDASGNAIVVWTQSDGTRFNLWANRFASGSWGVPTAVEMDDSTVSDPQIAMDASGNAMVVWNQYGASAANIASARYLYGQGWTPVALVENDDGNALYPQLATTPTGTTQVVWQQFRDGSRYDIYANRYRPDRGWDTPTLVGNEDAGASHSATTPQISIEADGTAQAIWLRNDGTRVNVWSARFE